MTDRDGKCCVNKSMREKRGNADLCLFCAMLVAAAEPRWSEYVHSLDQLKRFYQATIDNR